MQIFVFMYVSLNKIPRYVIIRHQSTVCSNRTFFRLPSCNQFHIAVHEQRIEYSNQFTLERDLVLEKANKKRVILCICPKSHAPNREAVSRVLQSSSRLHGKKCSWQRSNQYQWVPQTLILQSIALHLKIRICSILGLALLTSYFCLLFECCLSSFISFLFQIIKDISILDASLHFAGSALSDLWLALLRSQKENDVAPPNFKRFKISLPAFFVLRKTAVI